MDVHESILKTETKLILVNADVENDAEQNPKETSSELSLSDTQLEIDTDESYEPPQERLARARKKAAAKKKAAAARIRAARKKRTHACETCGKCYTNRGSLKWHRRTCSNPDGKPCNRCQMSFATADALKYHMIGHLRNRPYRCRINCSKRFRSQCNRTVHESVCGSTTLEPDTELSVPPDEIIVDGVKMYVCRKTLGCEKAFFSLRNKNLHEEACQPVPPVKMEISVEESRLAEQPSPESGGDDERTGVDVCFVGSVKQEVIVIDDDGDSQQSIECDLVFVDGVHVYVCAKCGEAIESPDIFRKHKAECSDDED